MTFSRWFIRFSLLAAVLLAFMQASPADEAVTGRSLLDASRRIVFLGDSITASGQYVAYFDAWLEATHSGLRPEVIDVGLPSETVSGLSEEGHAGGQFPRPDLFERLDRVLGITKPDLVFACYGMNCGIYQPLDEQRFDLYRQGISRLKAAVEKSGAQLILVTPPIYDDQQRPLPFSYNDVLEHYSQWLLGHRADGWRVVDLHGPMTREVERRRASDPKFTFDPDGVHPNDEGHWFIAQQLIGYFGDPASAAAATPQAMLSARGAPAELLSLVSERLNLLRDAYVAAAGHKRPGVAAGLPVAEAEKRAAGLTQRIGDSLAASEVIRHSFFVAGPTFTGIIDEAGQESWNAGRPGARDGWVLPDGHVLIAWDNEVLEMTRDKQVVFRYSLAPENREIGTAARLADGNTLVTELGARPRLLECDPTGKIVLEVALQPDTDNAHMQTRMARKLPGGTYLVPHLLAFQVKEYAATGAAVAQIATDLPEWGGRAAETWPFTAIRLADGNTLVDLTHGNRVVEFDASGKVAWQVSNDDLAEKPFVDPCGCQRLPNGNTVVASYGAQQGIKVFEITRDRRLVWKYDGPHRAHEIQVLTTNGKPIDGAPLK